MKISKLSIKYLLFILIISFTQVIDLFGQPGGYPPEAPGILSTCQIDINCALGTNLSNYKDGVGLLYLKIDNTYPYYSKHTGSAFIIRTAVSGSNIIMTAGHNILGLNTWDDMWIRYRYYGSCGGGNPTSVSTYKAFDTLSTANDGDIQLIKLIAVDNGPVNGDYLPRLGWSLLDQTGSDAKSIGHPEGNAQKVTSYNSLYKTVDHNHDVWGMTVDEGFSQNGQSGSPVFNSSNYVIGVVGLNTSMNCSGTSGSGIVFAQRLSKYYRSFSEYLDPYHTGAVQVPSIVRINGSFVELGSYKYPSVSSTSPVCYGNAGYATINNFCEFMEGNVTWSITSGGSLVDTTILENGKKLQISPKYSSSKGEVSVTAEIDFGSFTKSYGCIIYIGKPTNNINHIDFGILNTIPDNQVPLYQNKAIGVASNSDAAIQGVTGYHWQFSSWQPYVTGYEDYLGYDDGLAGIYLTSSSSSQQIVEVSAINACGYEWEGGAAKMFYANSGYYMVMSPNPAVTNETTINIESVEEKAQEKEVNWELVIYDQTRNIKYKQQGLNKKQFTINTSGWKKGIYIVHIEYNGELLTDKLIVE